ncbi:unnamed protein product [Schistosoma haematobium]|nr:unnamed protein product [Schistosoma haematobium]CAH8607973.1 unnamed protein product [Schistosoma haematobium]
MYRILIRQITYHMICNYTLHTTQFHRFTLCTEKHNITITVIIIIIRFICMIIIVIALVNSLFEIVLFKLDYTFFFSFL